MAQDGLVAVEQHYRLAINLTKRKQGFHQAVQEHQRRASDAVYLSCI